MKIVEYSEEKREIILLQRGIDMEELADMIDNWEYIDILDNKNHPNQKLFIINYHGYIVCIPYVEDDEKIFLKTAYHDRRYNKKFNS